MNDTSMNSVDLNTPASASGGGGPIVVNLIIEGWYSIVINEN